LSNLTTLPPGTTRCQVTTWGPFTANPLTLDGLSLLSVAVMPFPGVQPGDRMVLSCSADPDPLNCYGAYCPFPDVVALTVSSFNPNAVLDPAPKLCVVTVKPGYRRQPTDGNK
jgi:hypothetical protein